MKVYQKITHYAKDGKKWMQRAEVTSQGTFTQEFIDENGDVFAYYHRSIIADMGFESFEAWERANETRPEYLKFYRIG